MRVYFRGSTTENAVGYACGDEIVFDLQLVCENGGEVKNIGCPVLHWR